MDVYLRDLIFQRNLSGKIQSKYGYLLTDAEARKYIEWALLNGYKYLSQVPDYEHVKDII